MKRLCSVLLLLFALGAYPASGQQVKTHVVSGEYAGVTFGQFASEIEAATAYRFYYDPAHLDSLRVYNNFQHQPLEQVLSTLFEGKDYQFGIDQELRVFIVKGQVLRGILPAAVFNPANTTRPIARETDAIQGTASRRRRRAEETRLHEIGAKTSETLTGAATLAGYVKDLNNGEAIAGAAIYVENLRIAAATNHSGFYSITLPKGRHELKIKSLGMIETRRQVLLYGDGKFDIEIEEDVIPLKEVIVEGDKDLNIAGIHMGVERLDIKTIRQVPTAFGEADLLRVVLTLPGVKSVGESSTGLHVRGGAADQNLVLLNDATIFNPSHLFGFFSAFNPDVVKNVELYKSNLPAHLGGRLSSVLEVNTREGNKKKFSGAGGIGLVTGRLTLEGPIMTDKTSFLIGGRSTYSNWLFSRIPNPMVANSKASFWDVNAQLSHEFNEKNSLTLHAYQSRDHFRLGFDTTFAYGNQAASLKWKRVFSNKLYSVVTATYSGYDFSIKSTRNPLTASRMAYAINQSNIKADVSYFPSANHTIDAGISSIHYKLHPGSQQPLGSESLVLTDAVAPEQALESALYINSKYDISSRLSLSAGLRYSLYNYLGPKSVYAYPEGLAKETRNITDTLTYDANKVINTYQGPEYRLAVRYFLNESTSLKASYNRTRQYLHMLTNTAMISPTDIWKLSDLHIRPQIGNQYSIGLFRNFNSNTIETSVETYYRTMANVLDFRSGAKLFLNKHPETVVLNAQGMAYGAEFMIRRIAGKLNGWISYTYSRSLLRTNSLFNQEVINQGKYYPSNFDKPHDMTMVANYKFSRRLSASFNITYSTGRPITLPMAVYEMDGAMRVYYSGRNQYRIPDFYRADLAINLEGNHKVKKLAHSSWTLAVYNLTGRRNPYSVFFVTERGEINGYRLSVFGQPIPTLTYNFKF